MNGAGLVIDHGDPWWLSPNVWAVPIASPDATSPGESSPAAGLSYYLKANVRNAGFSPADNVQVKLYWANPATVITRSSAHVVGSAFVSVDAGQVADVLCLTPWVPTYVNQGHECIVAEIVQSGSQATGVLDGANDPLVAQHNLSIIMTSTQSFHAPFEVVNPDRKEQTFQISTAEPTRRQLQIVSKMIGERTQLTGDASLVSLGFVTSPCPDKSNLKNAQSTIEGLRVEPFGRVGFSLVGQIEGKAALIHITQSTHDLIVGGISVLVLRDGQRTR